MMHVRRWFYIKFTKPTLGVAAIPEVVLLSVGVTEDVIAHQVNCDDQRGLDRAKFDLVEHQVAGLQGVDERDPGKVSDCEHKAEPIAGDVHRGEDGGLCCDRQNSDDMERAREAKRGKALCNPGSSVTYDNRR